VTKSVVTFRIISAIEDRLLHRLSHRTSYHTAHGVQYIKLIF